jgi:hypothetical protein
MTFKIELCSVAKTSKISLPLHISLTKNGLFAPCGTLIGNTKKSYSYSYNIGIAYLGL